MERDRRYTITALYCIIFYALMLYKYFNGMLLFQLQPSFFYSREDIFTWVFMQTRLHEWLLNNKPGCILFDILFYSAPAIYFQHFRVNRLSAYISAAWMLIVNWVYVQCYTLYPANSIEGHVAWLLFPLVFIARKDQTFRLLLDGLRYFLLFFFASAGLWKLRQGGVFDHLQMSGVLLYQHSQLLTNSPGYWQSKFIMWLVQHAWVSYILYLLATVIELSFITGFFTKKFDRVLAVLFILFLIMDNLVMRIPYYELLPLLLTLVPGAGRTAGGEAGIVRGKPAI